MASTDAIIKIDTTELDKATKKIEYLTSLVEKLYDLASKSWLISLLLGIKNNV